MRKRKNDDNDNNNNKLTSGAADGRLKIAHFFERKNSGAMNQSNLFITFTLLHLHLI